MDDKNSKEDSASAKDVAPKEPVSDLARLESDVEKLKHELLLQRADFENARRRLEKQKQDDVKYASLPLVRDLVHSVDNLELALSHATEDDPMRKGVAMVLDGMLKTLAKFDIKKVGEKGEKFNPSLHEAFSMATDPGLPDESIIEVARPGYIFHDRLIRAAGVIVNRIHKDEAPVE
jgi:molecular chaperone GrpE